MAKRLKKVRAEHISDYPKGFVAWAGWFVDLSITAPSLDKQLQALLPEWEKVSIQPTPADTAQEKGA